MDGGQPVLTDARTRRAAVVAQLRALADAVEHNLVELWEVRHTTTPVAERELAESLYIHYHRR